MCANLAPTSFDIREIPAFESHRDIRWSGPSAGGGFGIHIERDRRSWVFLNDQKDFLTYREQKQNCSPKSKTLKIPSQDTIYLVKVKNGRFYTTDELSV